MLSSILMAQTMHNYSSGCSRDTLPSQLSQDTQPLFLPTTCHTTNLVDNRVASHFKLISPTIHARSPSTPANTRSNNLPDLNPLSPSPLIFTSKDNLPPHPSHTHTTHAPYPTNATNSFRLKAVPFSALTQHLDYPPRPLLPPPQHLLRHFPCSDPLGIAAAPTHGSHLHSAISQAGPPRFQVPRRCLREHLPKKLAVMERVFLW